MRKENKRMRTVRDKKPKYRKRNHRLEIKRTYTFDDSDDEEDDDEDDDDNNAAAGTEDADSIIGFIAAMAVILILFFICALCGYLSATRPTQADMITRSLNPWMRNEIKEMEDLHLNWKNANTKLFQTIIKLERGADLRNVTNNVRSLEDFYVKVSKTLQECEIASIQTVEEHLIDNKNNTKLSLEKKEKIDDRCGKGIGRKEGNYPAERFGSQRE